MLNAAWKGLTLDSGKPLVDNSGATVPGFHRLPSKVVTELGGIARRRQDLSELVLATRLVFLCHAATRSMREGGFPDSDEPADDGGLGKARALTVRPAPQRVVTAPALAARQTARALGLAATVAPALADIDPGAWRGRNLVEVQAREPEALMGWIAEPAAGAPGGETFAGVMARVAAWMDDQAGGDVRLLAVTHPTVIRAALAHVLCVPPSAAFRIDVAPLSMLTLSHHRQWRFQGLGAEGPAT